MVESIEAYRVNEKNSHGTKTSICFIFGYICMNIRNNDDGNREKELEIGQPISIFVHLKKNWESKYFVTPYYKNIKKEGVLLT